MIIELEKSTVVGFKSLSSNGVCSFELEPVDSEITLTDIMVLFAVKYSNGAVTNGKINESTTCDKFKMAATPDLPENRAMNKQGMILIVLVKNLLKRGFKVQLILPSAIIIPAIVHITPAAIAEKNIAKANIRPAWLDI